MSVRDLAVLARHLIEDFPEFYPLFAEKQFEFDGRAPSNINNRNPLLNMGIGADGLKTGHTNEAGYGLVGSAKQGDRRVIFVISGLDSERARAEEAGAIVNWSFRQFAEKTVAKAGEPIAEAEVWMGREQTVSLVAPDDLEILLPVLSSGPLTAEVVYRGPIEAPGPSSGVNNFASRPRASPPPCCPSGRRWSGRWCRRRTALDCRRHTLAPLAVSRSSARAPWHMASKSAAVRESH